MGSTAFNVSASPPTMKTNSPFFAPQSPPVTGASRKGTLRSAQAEAIFLASAGDTVLESMYVLPGFIPASAPASLPLVPQSTPSSAGGSLTIVIRTCEAAATSFGDFASLAPSPTNSFARLAVRFQTVRGKPAFNKFVPIGWPIKPRASKPTFVFELAADSTRALLCEVCREAGIRIDCTGLTKNAGTHLPANRWLI